MPSSVADVTSVTATNTKMEVEQPKNSGQSVTTTNTNTKDLGPFDILEGIRELKAMPPEERKALEERLWGGKLVRRAFKTDPAKIYEETGTYPGLDWDGSDSDGSDTRSSSSRPQQEGLSQSKPADLASTEQKAQQQ